MPADRPAQERGEGIRRWTIPVCAVHGYVPNYCICTEDPELVKRVTRVVVADEQAVRREALREAAEKLRGHYLARIGDANFLGATRVLDSLASEPEAD